MTEEELVGLIISLEEDVYTLEENRDNLRDDINQLEWEIDDFGQDIERLLKEIGDLENERNNLERPGATNGGEESQDPLQGTYGREADA